MPNTQQGITVTPVACARHRPSGRLRAFVYIEILIAMLLISMAMGSVVATHIRASKILRSSVQMAAASQILQERLEALRGQQWDKVASSKSLAKLLTEAPDSEAEIADSNLSETITVTVPVGTTAGLKESARAFSLRRVKGNVVVDQADDFTLEQTLLIEGGISWEDGAGKHERCLRTVLCRSGLTRSGIVGSVFGRPDSRTSSAR